jgi:branched-chain amino acid aminotransferase
VRSMTSVDGVITPTEDARIPVLDRGFLYGDSVYEVFRTYRGVPLFYAEHWDRFKNSASLIHLELGLTLEELTRRIKRTIAATGAPQSRTDVYVRYTVTRGAGTIELFPDPGLAPSCVIIVKPVPDWSAALYERGVRLAVPDTRRNAGTALDPNIKGGNYLNNVIALIEARRLGAEDCLMLDSSGLVTEASNSNVFFVIDGQVVTPSQTARNLKGITKAAVRDAFRAHGVETFEREIDEHDVTRASECFLTSATREVMPVGSVRLSDGREVRFPPRGEWAQRAARHYRDYVDAYIDAHPALSLLD